MVKRNVKKCERKGKTKIMLLGARNKNAAAIEFTYYLWFVCEFRSFFPPFSSVSVE